MTSPRVNTGSNRRRSATDDARSVALEVLRHARDSRQFVQETLHAALDQFPLPDRERRLATELVYGVIRRRRTLDALLAGVVRRPLDRVQVDVLHLLRLGAYQIVLLDAIPPYAAVHESVQLTRRLGLSRASGFVNGALRALARELGEGFDSEPGAAAVPFDQARYRRMQRAVLPDPAANPLEYVATGFSLPDWFVARRAERADFAELCRLGFWFNGRPPLYVRANPLRMSRDELVSHWQEAGIVAEPAEHPQSVRLPEGARVIDLPGFREGWFTVQDLSAMGAASLMAPGPGRSVLDLCAAPGGKATHLAELMEDRGRVVACDVDPERLRLVGEQSDRLGLGSIETLAFDAATDLFPIGEGFDAVLIDAPCSNTGVLGRRPEARWRIQPSDIVELAELQRGLLRHAAELVKPGGRLLYVTCSIEPEENENVVAAVVRENTELELLGEEELTPGKPADGGYRALLKRRDV